MQLQDAFDRAARGVIEQGKPSSWAGCCQYLTVVGDETLRCGVGHLLPDDNTRWEWDNSVGALADFGPGVEDVLKEVGLGDLPTQFLVDLQKAHDYAEEAYRERGKDFLSEFRIRMAALGRTWKLDLGAVQ